MRLKDVAVLVTGGGSGLGAATARGMAAKGAKIGVLDQAKENADPRFRGDDLPRNRSHTKE